MKKASVVAEKAFMYNNYFAIFGIEPNFNIDLDKLEKNYIDLSRILHPDINLEQCKDIVAVNKAYAILKSPVKRAEHVLDLANITNRENYLNTEVLNESMEIREYLLSCDDLEFAGKMINAKIKDCIKSLTNAFTRKNFNDATMQVFRLKYLYKSLEEVKKNAANSNF